jgi:hypothetical protein
MIRPIVRVLMLYIAFPYILKTTHYNKKFCETDFFFIENIFVMFGGYVFQQTVSFPMGTNCTLFANLFLYSYAANLIDGVMISMHTSSEV